MGINVDEQELSKKYHKEHLSNPIAHFILIRKLLSYIRPYAFYAAISLFFLLIARVIDVIVPLYIGFVVQKIINTASMDLVAKERLLHTFLDESLFIGGLLILGYVIDLISMVIKNWIGQKAIYTLRSQVYNHIQNLPVERFDLYPIGRLMTRTIHDIDQINQMFTESVIPLLGSILLFIGMIIGMAFLNWKIAIAFYLIVPFVGWLTVKFQYYQQFCYEIIRNIVSAMNTFFQENLSGMSTVRAFGLEKKEKKRFDELNDDHREANMLASHHFSFFIAGIDLLQSLSLIFVFALLVFLIPKGTAFEAGVFFTFSLYAVMFFRPLIDLADRYNILQSAFVAADRVFSTLEKPVEVINHSTKHFEFKEVNSIVFEDVWFAYEPGHWILKGISFEINKGESIALVGVTGAGKSTIINLLMRFYDYQKGSIKINGENIRDYPLYELRELFSVVLQDPVIFSGTIADNIGLHNPAISLGKIQKVIYDLNLPILETNFPRGLQHHLKEHGESLSMGERQLISLVRSVVHRRSVIMFDEATANIDTATEKMIQGALRKVFNAQTALIIAHRLSTIQDVSRILVLYDGKIKESGTHQELLGQKGLYEKLYRLQFNQLDERQKQ